MRKNLLSKALSIFTAALVGAACIASPSFTALAAEEETAEYTYTVYPMFAAGENEYYGEETGTATASPVTFSGDGTYTVSIDVTYDAEAIDLLLLDSDINLYKFGDAAHADNDTLVELSGLKMDINYIEFTSTGNKYLCENDDDSSTVPSDNGTTLRKNIYNTWAESVVTDIDPAAHPITAGETIVVSFTISGLDGRNPDSTSTDTGMMTSTYAEETTTTTATTTTTTTGTGDLYTTTGYAIQLACSEENVTLYPGHTQSFYLYYKTGPTSFSESYPVTFEFENEGIAAVIPDPDAGTSDYIIEALSVGTTKLTIKQQYGYTTLTCEMNITVEAQTTTTAPVTNVPSETTYITTAAPALVCSPSAVTVEAGKLQPVIMSFASGLSINDYPGAFEIDSVNVAGIVESDYPWCFFVEGMTEGTANITITPPYGYDKVTIPVTVIPADDDDSNDASVHIVIDKLFNTMIPKGNPLSLGEGSYSVYKHDGTSTSMEKVLSKVSMSAETENVTVDASAFDSSAPGYYDVIITYTDDDGYTDTVTLCTGVYYFESMDTTTTPVTTTTTTTRTTEGIELDRTELTVAVGLSDYVGIRSASGGVYPRFEIEDESIVEITPDEESFGFYVKGLAEGTTTIKVIDGEYYSEIVEVTVVPYVTTTTIATTTTIVGTHTGEAADGTTVNLTTANTEITTTTVMGIVLSDSEIELEAGQRFGIGISKTDGRDYFDGAFVECTSDNPKVAVVQHSDIPYTIYVVGMAEGTANITVYDPAFGSTATLKVTVTGTADNTIGKDVSIVIDSEPLKLQYNIGEELDLTGGMYRVVNDSTGDNVYGPYGFNTGRVITDAFDNTTAGTYPIYISYNNPMYGYWDVYVLYVTVVGAGAETTGDIDANGKIDLDDAAAALTCYAKNAVGIATTTPAEADVDGNGKVDLDDAAYILTYYARNAAGLPCTWDEIIIG